MKAEPAIFPVTRECIVHEYQDGDIAVKVLVEAEETEAFFKAFPDGHEAVFLSNGREAVRGVRGALIREYADGSIAFKLLIAPVDRAVFRRLFPRPGTAAVLAREDPATGRQAMMDDAAAVRAAASPLFGKYARELRLHAAFMRNPKVWREVGTDAQFLEYIRGLPCAKCRWQPHWEGEDFWQCEAAHVRRIASGAGTAEKPPYSAIPLCPTRLVGDTIVEGCHRAQHRLGESALGGKEHVDKLRIHYVQEWLWAALKASLGFEHWNEVPPRVLAGWAEEHGVLDCLPDVYLEAVA